MLSSQCHKREQIVKRKKSRSSLHSKPCKVKPGEVRENLKTLSVSRCTTECTSKNIPQGGKNKDQYQYVVTEAVRSREESLEQP